MMARVGAIWWLDTDRMIYFQDGTLKQFSQEVLVPSDITADPPELDDQKKKQDEILDVICESPLTTHSIN